MAALASLVDASTGCALGQSCTLIGMPPALTFTLTSDGDPLPSDLTIVLRNGHRATYRLADMVPGTDAMSRWQDDFGAGCTVVSPPDWTGPPDHAFAVECRWDGELVRIEATAAGYRTVYLQTFIGHSDCYAEPVQVEETLQRED